MGLCPGKPLRRGCQIIATIILKFGPAQLPYLTGRGASSRHCSTKARDSPVCGARDDRVLVHWKVNLNCQRNYTPLACRSKNQGERTCLLAYQPAVRG